MQKKIYGLSNCDSTKATLKWMKANNIPYIFHDFKVEGIGEEKLKEWLKETTMEKLLNKKSTTWRSLSAEEQSGAAFEGQAIKLILVNSSLIKRPVIETGGKLDTIGVVPGKAKK